MKKHYALWAGDDLSFHTYLTAMEESLKHPKGFDAGVTYQGTPVAKDASPQSKILSIEGKVGIIKIEGALTNKDAWYNSFFGLTSYGSIIDAAYEAAADNRVSEILLLIDSPGGAVDGVMDAVSALNKVGEIKPITAFTSSVMASAAMWIGSTAKERYLTPTAIGGSIGIVAKHVEYSKMNAQDGVTETVFRAGKYKQLQNSAEPLTELAKEEMQAKLEYTYGVMTKSIADNLGTTAQHVDGIMGQGREFIGQQAVDVGLFNGVMSFEQLVAHIQNRIGDGTMNKKYGMAAVLAGAGNMQATGGETVPPEEKPEETPTASAEGSEGTTSGEAPDTKVADLEAALATATADLAAASEKLSAAEASMAPLKEMAASVINNMLVALGGTVDMTLTAKTPEELKAMYDETTGRMLEAIKVGGVAAPEEKVSTPAQASAPTRWDRAVSNIAFK